MSLTYSPLERIEKNVPKIVLESYINAPAKVCFDLIRDERIQAQPPPAMFGEFGLGQTVKFEGTHFAMRQHLTVKVVEFDRPRRFVDAMTKGAFNSFVHIHEWEPCDGGTLMRDTLIWESPFGILGKIVDKLLLERHLSRLVSTRNAKLKEIAESQSS